MSFKELLASIETGFGALELRKEDDQSQDNKALVMHRAWGPVQQPQLPPRKQSVAASSATTTDKDDEISKAETAKSSPVQQSHSLPSLTSSTFSFEAPGPGNNQPVFVEGIPSISIGVDRVDPWGALEDSPRENIPHKDAPRPKKARSTTEPSNKALVPVIPASNTRIIRPQKSSANLAIPFIFQTNAASPAVWPPQHREIVEAKLVVDDWTHAQRCVLPETYTSRLDLTRPVGTAPPQYHIGIEAEPLQPVPVLKGELSKSWTDRLVHLIHLNNQKFSIGEKNRYIQKRGEDKQTLPSPFILDPMAYADTLTYLIRRHNGSLSRVQHELEYCLALTSTQHWEATVYGAIETFLAKSLLPIASPHKHVGIGPRQDFMRKLFHSLCVANFSWAQKRDSMAFCWNCLKELTIETDLAILEHSVQNEKGSVLLYKSHMNKEVEVWNKTAALERAEIMKEAEKKLEEEMLAALMEDTEDEMSDEEL